jgi:hypothetical protein
MNRTAGAAAGRRQASPIFTEATKSHGATHKITQWPLPTGNGVPAGFSVLVPLE